MKKRRILSVVCVLVICIFTILPVSAAASDVSAAETSVQPRTVATFRCTGDYVNIRKGPGLSYDILGQMMKGQTGLVQSFSGDWVYVIPANPSLPSGWSHRDYIKLMEP